MLGFFVNDPYAASWVIFFSYFAVAILCARAFRVSWIGSRMAAEYPGPDRRRDDRRAAYKASFLFWGLMIAVFILLGINKQIDLQTWITIVGREIAYKQGWYEQRGTVQTIVVLFMAVAGLATVAILLRSTRDLLPRHTLAFYGLSLTAIYMTVRATSIHDVEEAMGIQILGLRIAWYLEMSGIVCVGACAVMNYWWHGKSEQPSTDEEPSAEKPSALGHQPSAEQTSSH